MDGNEYQKLAGRTLLEDAPFRFTVDEENEVRFKLELAIKIGKEIDDLKKKWFHNHGETKTGEKGEWGSVEIMLLWNIFGLIGEAAEVADTVLDWLENFTPENTEFYRERMAKELGDCAWYNAATATKCGLSLSDIMEANIAKLKARYPEGFTSEHSNLRLDGEPLYETSLRASVDE